MKLIDKGIEEKFEKYKFGSQEELGWDAKVIVKYFNPVGVGTWLITEAEKQEGGDYLLFGYCHLGDDECAELGYVMLSELENLKLPLGMTIERDLYMSEDITLKEAIKQNGFKLPFYVENEEVEDDEEYFN